ncbi:MULTISPECIES: TetR/AcrR family transcriptional regulator [Rhizobium]|uniref:Transcriptional regulator, TetR family n=1 Tax=Rhizobium miluonense TaxID=411945 RepID=A0A1C3VZ60_9HYPH|nr:TetR/AcrR family transcriptional regulator [Rhizobium miluonense]SCB32989.1 transcriptional regulator, TetR family [Rhizobium miluonense]
MSGGRPRDETIDQELQATALALFAEGGLAAVSFDQVAKRAGVSRTALYRRWATREALVTSALLGYRARAESGLEDWASRPLGEILEIFVDQTAAAFSDPFARNLLRQLFALSDQEAEIKHLYWSTIVEPRRKAFSLIIRQAQQNHEIDQSLDPELMQDLLSGAISYRLLAYPGDDHAMDAKAYVTAVLRAAGFPIQLR